MPRHGNGAFVQTLALSVCHATQVKGTNQTGLLIRSRLFPCLAKQECLPNKPVARTAWHLLTWLLVKYTITDALVKFHFSWELDFRHHSGHTQLHWAACLDEEIYSQKFQLCVHSREEIVSCVLLLTTVTTVQFICTLISKLLWNA